MTYEMRIERMLDAPAELVFDTMLDPAFKDEIYTDLVDGWSARRFEVDLRVGGTWRTEFGPRDSERDRRRHERVHGDRPAAAVGVRRLDVFGRLGTDRRLRRGDHVRGA